MIKIRFNKDEITALGHSGYAEPGKDIVCAGVSSAFKMAIATLIELKAMFNFHVDDNKAFIGIQLKKGTKQTHRAVFKALVETLRLIAEEYPDNVTVEHVIEKRPENKPAQ